MNLDRLNRQTHLWIFLAKVIVLGILLNGSANAQENEALMEKAIATAVDKVAPSVLRLDTIGGDRQVDGESFNSGPGTCLVVGEDGWLLTASFFLANQPAGVIVTLPGGKRVPAEVTAHDRSRHLTLLKVETDNPLKVGEFASRNSIAVGQTVVAIGKTIEGGNPNLSVGIVSASNRIWGKAIQTDAKISPANFGGPLVNLDGEIVGILAPLSTRSESVLAGTEWYDSGIGFAVPVDEVVARLGTLKSGQDLLPGQLGVELEGQDIYADPAKVAFCLGSSPAGKAGILIGDTIIECNGQPITRIAQFKHAIGPLYAGDTLALTLENDGVKREATATLVAELPPYRPAGIGIALSQQDKSFFVRQVIANSSAEKAGIEIGDRLLKAAGKAIKRTTDLRMAIASVAIGNSLTLEFERNDATIEVVVELDRWSTSIPEEVAGLNPAEGNSEILEITVAEDTNSCFAILPPGELKTQGPPSLLVWIPPSGKVDREKMLATWGDRCRTANTILLVPESKKEDRWELDEVEFVRRAIAVLRKQKPISAERIAIGGRAASGTFASLVAFSEPGTFGGLILDRAAASRKIGDPKTSPVQPLMVLVSGEADDEAIKASLVPLREAEFLIESQPTVSLEELMRWINLIDRF